MTKGIINAYKDNDEYLESLFKDKEVKSWKDLLERVAILNCAYSALSKTNSIRIIDIAKIFYAVANELYEGTFSKVENTKEDIIRCLKNLHSSIEDKEMNNFLSFATKYLFWSKYANCPKIDCENFYIYDSHARNVIEYIYEKKLRSFPTAEEISGNSKQIGKNIEAEYSAFWDKYNYVKNDLKIFDCSLSQYQIDKKVWAFSKKLDIQF